MVDEQRLEGAIWSIADERASDDDWAAVRLDVDASLAVLRRLIVQAEDDLASVQGLRGDERDQVVADFESTVDSLRGIVTTLRPPPPRPEPEPMAADGHGQERGQGRGPAPARRPAEPDQPEPAPVVLEPEVVRLQGSWSAGQLVVWAGGRGVVPESNDELATRLETVNAPPNGWDLHAPIELPGGIKADALTIPMRDALGWLTVVGAGDGVDGVAPSLLWLGRVVVEGVRLAARGSIVPTLDVARRTDGRFADTAVRWRPALVDQPALAALAGAMPGPVAAIDGGDGRGTMLAVITAVVEAIVAESAARMELPAAPPSARTPIDLADAVIARMGGDPFPADARLAGDVARGLEHWTHAVTAPARPHLVVRLDEPRAESTWLVSVHLGSKGKLIPIDAALRADHASRTVAVEWARVERAFPALGRSRMRRRGQVALSQAEAWEFMTMDGPRLAAIGFDVRAPQLATRKATTALRLYADTPTGTAVGARQLSNVTWSVLVDGVELTREDVARLARQARPLVQAGGRWVEVDRVDLEKAAQALAARESMTQLSGADILRQSMGLDGTGLSGGVVVHGANWANDIVRKASEARAEAVTRPDGFLGELRQYQAEALAWIRFLAAAELGGCLALDMGLGKTPTVLAHLAGAGAEGPALVVTPAAVVGNWAAEAARFTPGLRVVVHHGATRATGAELAAAIAEADVVITTYATAVRDIDALSALEWTTIVLDEAQAIKNPGSETAQQLRRLPARTRLALTGTPIENGLGDLWAILDFTNPGLVGPRATFLSQMAGEGEAALRALNGILLFRRTKAEPEVAAELPDKIDELDHCTMTTEQVGLYQAVLDQLLASLSGADGDRDAKKGAILAAITALKQVCNHPAAYRDDGQPLAGRSGKLTRLEEIVESVFAVGERILVFTHFASWGRRLAEHLSQVTGVPIACYDGSLARGVRDRLVAEFQDGEGPGALVLSLKAGGTGLNLTAANHVVLYDRWWNPAVEDQARDRAWRIGQGRTVISHRLVCPGTVDERVEEVVAGKRQIAQLVLPKASSIADLDTDQLRLALGLRPDELLAEDDG